MLGNRTCIKIVISCLNLYTNTADAKYRPVLVPREKGFLILFSKAKEAFLKRVNPVTLMEASEV